MSAVETTALRLRGCLERRCVMQVIETSMGEEEKAGANLLSERAQELNDAVSRYRPMFYKKAFRYLGNAPDAEDAVQDGLLSACKHLSQFIGETQRSSL